MKMIQKTFQISQNFNPNCLYEPFSAYYPYFHICGWGFSSVTSLGEVLFLITVLQGGGLILVYHIHLCEVYVIMWLETLCRRSQTNKSAEIRFSDFSRFTEVIIAEVTSRIRLQCRLVYLHFCSLNKHRCQNWSHDLTAYHNTRVRLVQLIWFL